LIERSTLARLGAIDPLLGAGGQRTLCCRLEDIASVALKSRKYPHHISIENRVRLIESDTGDGGGRVVANAGEPPNYSVIARKLAAVRFCNYFCGPL